MPYRRDRLATRRATTGWTQESLAEHLRVDRSTVARWERGTATPQPWIRAQLAGAVRITVDQLEVLLLPADSPDDLMAMRPVPEPNDVEQLRQSLDDVLTVGSLAEAGLDDWEQLVRRHGRATRDRPVCCSVT